VLKHLAAVDLKTLAKLDTGFVDQLFKQRLALDQRQLPEIMAVQVKQVEGDHHDLGRLALQLILQNRKVSGAVGGRDDDLALEDRRAGTDVPGVGGDFLETVRPVVAVAGEDLDLGVSEMHLNVIAIELDLVDPTIAARCLADRRGQRGRNEAREQRLRADRRGLLALEPHSSHHAHRKRKLNVVISAFVPLDELFQVKRHVAELEVTPTAQLLGNLARDVFGPFLGGVEADDPNGIVVLPRK
jgi:hypothetical protein